MSKIAVFATLATLITPAGEPMYGNASRYDPYVMEGVVALRYANDYWRVTPPPENAPYIKAYIAVADCSLVGDVVKIRPVNGPSWERALVADCAGNDGTPEWMKTNRIVAELDYETFRRWADLYGTPLEMEMWP